MVDTCTIAEPATETFDPDTGDYTTTPGAILYAGKCRVQVSDSIGTDGEAVGEQLVVSEKVTVSIPASADPVPINSVVTITAVADVSTVAVGATYRVTGSHAGSHKTARRLPCEMVTP